MNVVEVFTGKCPLILAMPHTGFYVPDDIAANLNENGRTLSDADWHIDELYRDLVPQASIVRATFHRYVIDANRAPSDVSLYPGLNTTGLCPVTDFDGNAIHIDGQQPDSREIEHRRKTYHAPYHEALQAEIERVYQRFGVVVLYDCHSIRSNIPYLFDGELPDFNVGTASGRSCAETMESQVVDLCTSAAGYTSVLNGRFKGGWTTRNYGRPKQNIHAIQMEIAQSTYLESEQHPFMYSPVKAGQIRFHLKNILEELMRQAYDISRKG